VSDLQANGERTCATLTSGLLWTGSFFINSVNRPKGALMSEGSRSSRGRLVFLGALLIALIVPVAAGANSVPTTGSRIAFFTPPTTYPADTPFYVEQGFVCYRDANAADCANAGTSFVLHVDGVQQPSQTDIDQITIGGIPGIFVRYLTNFPQGLPAGSHTFTGDFYFNGNFYEEDSITVTFT
jgi:hypothetical protein